jgi:hypothetical protein
LAESKKEGTTTMAEERRAEVEDKEVDRGVDEDGSGGVTSVLDYL